MGAVVSLLASVAKTARVMASIPGDLHGQYRALEERIDRSPGLPRPSPTASFWLENPPFPELVDVQSPTLPVVVDVIVIGSGITSVAVVRALLENDGTAAEDAPAAPPPPTVAVLEARQLCNGATGRNGGHIKVSPHEAFDHLVHKGGLAPARAATLVRFQLAHLSHLLAVAAVEDEAGLAECRTVDTVDLFVDEEAFCAAQATIGQLRVWVPECSMAVWSGAEAREKFATGLHVVGAISYRAGALWPYRFVTLLWRRLLDAHAASLSLETGTPVEAVAVAPDDCDHPYRVVTPRGTIHARHIVHATNAFASHLLPALRRKMTGLRAHMSAQQPGTSFPTMALGGQRSWSILYGGGSAGFDYLTQRPPSSSAVGELLYGGGFVRSAGQGMDQIAVYDDTTVDLLTAIHLHGTLPLIFGPSWGPSAPAAELSQQSHVNHLWSGIIAATADMLPLVGRLDNAHLTGRAPPTPLHDDDTTVLPGEWLSASYMGDGMVWAWLCGTAVGLMVAGRDREELPARPGRPAGRVADWLPPELLATHARLAKVDIRDLADLML